MIIEKVMRRDAKYPVVALRIEDFLGFGNSAEFVVRALANALSQANVVVNMAKVDYANSTGIGEVIAVCVDVARDGRRLVLSNVPRHVIELATLLDSTHALRVFSSEKQAALHVIEWGTPHIPSESARRETNQTSAADVQSRPPARRVRKQQSSKPARDESVRGMRSLQIFLCHASNDKTRVRSVAHELSIRGVNVWFDEEKLLPGQDWRIEIQRALRAVDAVVVCLSGVSVSKTGYVQKEIKYALELADEQPEGSIFIIPAKLEPCKVPDRLARWQWVDLSASEGMLQLVRGLNQRAVHVGAVPLRP